MNNEQTRSPATDRPWEGLDPEALRALAPHLPALADEIMQAVSQDVPEYARPLEGAFGRGVRLGVEQALAQFVEMARSPGAGRAGGRNVYVALGRAELRAGRSLDALLAAYRVGARVAWRRLAEAGLQAGLSPETLVRLAESIFAYIDQLSAESAEGYAEEQAERAGDLERRRGQLIELLLQVPAADPGAIAAAAEAARWLLPSRLAVAVWSAELGRRPASGLPLGHAATSVGGLVCALIPDPEGPSRQGEIRRALASTTAGLGPPVVWPQTAVSFARATAALGLAEERDLGLVCADDHRTTLLWRTDPALVEEMATDRLAPLRAETEASRQRLERTLLAWLRHDGNIAGAAAELEVHPQTVRYRLGRLRELFGDALDDPDARFELELSLRALPMLPLHTEAVSDTSY